MKAETERKKSPSKIDHLDKRFSITHKFLALLVAIDIQGSLQRNSLLTPDRSLVERMVQDAHGIIMGGSRVDLFDVRHKLKTQDRIDFHDPCRCLIFSRVQIGKNVPKK